MVLGLRVEGFRVWEVFSGASGVYGFRYSKGLLVRVFRGLGFQPV